MNIIATQYQRDDGCSIIRLRSGNWAIRKFQGPAWFYCIPGYHRKGEFCPNGDGDNDGGWVYSAVQGFEVEQFGYPFELAMKVLETVEK